MFVRKSTFNDLKDTVSTLKERVGEPVSIFSFGLLGGGSKPTGMYRKFENLEDEIRDSNKGNYKTILEELEDLRDHLGVEYVKRNGYDYKLETKKKGRK